METEAPTKKYVFTDDMAEISGFGGSYEKACRDMIVAGLEWFDEHPTAEPKFHGFKDVYGIMAEDNEDAKALSEAVTAVSDDVTGAMHQASIQHIMYIRKNGWEKYSRIKREQKVKEDQDGEGK